MSEHVEQKCKPRTAAFYRHLLDKIIKPEVGVTKADKVTRVQVARLHGKLKATPFQANRVLAVLGSIYTFAGRSGIVAEGMNPARRVDQFKERRRERFLTGGELERLGSAIREAETKGIPWSVDEAKPKAKHLPKAENRFTKIGPFAVAAIRLLLFTGFAYAKSCTSMGAGGPGAGGGLAQAGGAVGRGFQRPSRSGVSRHFHLLFQSGHGVGPGDAVR